MEAGRIIGGKYRLSRELGEGAMGSVWAATHEVLGRDVAIKFLLPTIEHPETAAARFVAEAKAAARVKHRFVVDVFDFGITEDGLHYMVQELLDGTSLAECMYDGPAWPIADVLRFTAQCLSGLEAVHEAGIVHRDLKPENIFVMADPEGFYPKLLDFGISKVSGDLGNGKSRARPSLRQGRPRRLTAAGTTVGTPAYMSPEQLCNASSINGRADLYSVGVILYEWLSGRLPIAETSNPTDLYRKIVARAATPLASLRPELDGALCALVERALHPEPQERFARAVEMRAELRKLIPSQRPDLSIVQRELGTSTAGTQALLAAAETPFHSDAELAVPGLGPSRPALWLGLGAAAALATAFVIAHASSSGRSEYVAPTASASSTSSAAPGSAPQERAAASAPTESPAVEVGRPEIPTGVQPSADPLGVVVPSNASPIADSAPRLTSATGVPPVAPDRPSLTSAMTPGADPGSEARRSRRAKVGRTAVISPPTTAAHEPSLAGEPGSPEPGEKVAPPLPQPINPSSKFVRTLDF